MASLSSLEFKTSYPEPCILKLWKKTTENNRKCKVVYLFNLYSFYLKMSYVDA